MFTFSFTYSGCYYPYFEQTKIPVTFVTGIDLHFLLYHIPFTRLARKCQRRGTDAASVLLVHQGICDEAYGALFVFSSNRQADEKVPEARNGCRRRTPSTSRHL